MVNRVALSTSLFDIHKCKGHVQQASTETEQRDLGGASAYNNASFPLDVTDAGGLLLC